MTSNTPQLPGRLGDATMSLGTDPRTDARLIEALTPFGLDGHPEDPGVRADTPLEQLHEFWVGAEAGFKMLNEALFAPVSPVAEVTSTTETISGGDGNDLTLYVHQPAGHGPDAAALPCVVHFHGGGMAIMEASYPGYRHWRNSLAATGMVVIGVEFRNAAGVLGNHPFPAGLNDCAAATRWAAANKAALNISSVVTSGESGGGNLSIATALKAKAEGWVDEIDGVYAQCPYIYGDYTNPHPRLVSLVENDAYFIETQNMAALAHVYDPSGDNARNPLAWPMHATADHVAGLPPHVISVNELDPLRDEGLEYARLLSRSGVSVVSRTVNGTCHAGDCLVATAMPDVYAATVQDIHRFATSL